MAELSTLARPYAKAAFQYALAKNDLTKWSKMTGLLANIAKQEKVARIFSSPALTADQQAKIVVNICGDEINKAAENFVNVLAKNKRLGLLSEISETFEQLKAEIEKTIDVEVTSAFALDEAAEENLAKALAKKFNCEIRIKSVVDNTLIGGVIIRAGDMIIDGSLRSRLTKLAEAMNS